MTREYTQREKLTRSDAQPYHETLSEKREIIGMVREEKLVSWNGSHPIIGNVRVVESHQVVGVDALALVRKQGTVGHDAGHARYISIAVHAVSC